MHRPRHQLKDELFLFAFNAPLIDFTRTPWVIMLHEYKSLAHELRFRWKRMKLQYVVMAGLIIFTLLMVQRTPHTIAKPRLCFTNGVIQGLQLFHQPFTAHMPSCLTKSFQNLTCLSKWLYSISLLLCLCAPWPTGFFWHCFVSSTRFLDCNSAILASFTESSPHSWWWHIFLTALVRLRCGFWRSQFFVTWAGDSDKIVHCFCCCFCSASSTFDLVLFRFLMSPQRINLLSNKEKRLQITFSKNYLVVLMSKLLRKICIQYHK